MQLQIRRWRSTKIQERILAAENYWELDYNSLCSSSAIDSVLDEPLQLNSRLPNQQASIDEVTWRARCDHVVDHCKNDEQYDRRAWWPDRLDTAVTVERSVGTLNNNCFRCTNCGVEFSNPSEHPQCRIWSCLFRLDSRYLFPWASEGKLWCILCGSYADPTDHCAFHRYRQCQQDLYATEEDFKVHLHNLHFSAELATLAPECLRLEFSRKVLPSFDPAPS
ncbi:hypothetical protein BDV96DRAFT_576684 [Lophiotrema nucula]|uniref:Uncharacterized protein n=1 Tax=Lophiotrema nucula TaxID=690887 RepID=A0A6A5Z7N2_9PLEO|nr:hypothetical protein BDV96DRAFT_576684 [Lophiotrema nucula]